MAKPHLYEFHIRQYAQPERVLGYYYCNFSTFAANFSDRLLITQPSRISLNQAESHSTKQNLAQPSRISLNQSRIQHINLYILPRLKLIWADAGYSGQLVDWVTVVCGWILEIVKLSDEIKGFKVLPHRWIVERTFGWLGRYRRLVKITKG